MREFVIENQDSIWGELWPDKKKKTDTPTVNDVFKGSFKPHI